MALHRTAPRSVRHCTASALLLTRYWLPMAFMLGHWAATAVSALAPHGFCPDWHGTVARLRGHRLFTALRVFTATLPRLHRNWPVTAQALSGDCKGSGLALQRDCIMTDILALHRYCVIVIKHTP